MAVVEGHFRKVWKQKGQSMVSIAPFERERGRLFGFFPADAPEMGSINPIEARPVPAGSGDHRP
jgi:hypothetical protein